MFYIIKIQENAHTICAKHQKVRELDRALPLFEAYAGGVDMFEDTRKDAVSFAVRDTLDNSVLKVLKRLPLCYLVVFEHGCARIDYIARLPQNIVWRSLQGEFFHPKRCCMVRDNEGVLQDYTLGRPVRVGILAAMEHFKVSRVPGEIYYYRRYHRKQKMLPIFNRGERNE